jgi:hypothetical protein
MVRSPMRRQTLLPPRFVVWTPIEYGNWDYHTLIYIKLTHDSMTWNMELSVISED